MDNLYSQGSISTETLGVYFAPESGSDTADSNGELTLGGVDTAKYTGTLTYVAKSTTGDFAYYWGVTVSSVTYGSTTLVSSNGAIVDTGAYLILSRCLCIDSYACHPDSGTTLIYIPTSGYNKFLSAAGGKTDSSSGLAVFTTKPT